MKSDITSRDDLMVVVREFYSHLLQNEEISHFFSAFKDANLLEAHLHTLVDFWDNTLFYSGTYQKNAIRPHLRLHEEKGFSQRHFDIWLTNFTLAVDRNFTGINAETIKNRAVSIATVMKLKMNLN